MENCVVYRLCFNQHALHVSPLSPFQWVTKMVTVKTNEETARAIFAEKNLCEMRNISCEKFSVKKFLCEKVELR